MLKWNYVISLKRRDDRWKELQERINNTCLKDENFVRFEAFDASNFDREVERLGMQDDFIIKMCRSKNIKVSKGVFGCYISHVKVLEEIINNKDISDDDYIGIYEDDFFPCKDIDKFNESYKYLKSLQKSLNKLEIDILFHGGRFNSDFMVPIHQFYLYYSFTKFQRVYSRNNNISSVDEKDSIFIDRTNNAYIVKKSSCPKLLKILKTFFLKKIDKNIHFIPNDTVYNNAYKQIKIYDFLPHIFWSPIDYLTDIQGQKNLGNLLDFSQI